MLLVRGFLSVALVYGVLAGSVHAQATSVTLQLFPYTGEVRLLNENPDPFAFTLYSLKSTSGALNGSDVVWKSISGNYDMAGNGFIDPTNNWLKFSSTATELSEGVFSGTGGVLPEYRAISLGYIWDPDTVPAPDVTALIKLPNGTDASVIIRESIDGDYLRDGVVDSFDYDFWKAFYGTTFGFTADGNIDGIVDAADYTIWRDNLGLALPGAGEGPAEVGGGGLSVNLVPEPTTGVLVLLSSLGLLMRTRRLDNCR